MTAAAIARKLDLLYGSPLSVVSSCLRGMLCAAPDHELFAADFANIEGRGLAWLAGEEWKLQAFRDYDAGVGPDLYLVAASKMYGVPVNRCKPHRPVGKVVELAGGFGGGVGAIRNMERALGVNLNMTDVQVDDAKKQWRQANSKIVTYWGDLESAALSAVKDPGQIYAAGCRGREIRFRVKGSFLWCMLPSKRVLCYPYPWIDKAYTLRLKSGARKVASSKWLAANGFPEESSVEREDDGVLFFMTVDGLTNKWAETSIYGGKWAENIDQGICRDLLAYAITTAEAKGYPVVAHVHDEVVSERRVGEGNLKEFEKFCAQTPAWAAGLPVVAAGWKGMRYRK